jgi:hypothetical protein
MEERPTPPSTTLHEGAASSRDGTHPPCSTTAHGCKIYGYEHDLNRMHDGERNFFFPGRGRGLLEVPTQ